MDLMIKHKILYIEKMSYSDWYLSKSLDIELIPSTATSCDQMKFGPGGDYTPVNEYI